MKQKLAAKKHFDHQDQAQFKQEYSNHTSEESFKLAFMKTHCDLDDADLTLVTTTDLSLQSITDCMHLGLQYPTRKK